MVKKGNNTEFMHQALKLAGRGIGYTSPNPMVGSLVVRDGVVLGRGYYREYGGEHAETQALREAGDNIRGAVLYVTLEPCCHQGRTPPCTVAIIESGIRKVYIAMLDPDGRVLGEGVKRLRAAGICVETGILKDEARDLNTAYIHHRQTGQPYVLLKLAQTLDGRIAASNGQSQWITGQSARERVHLIRSRADAVLVGINTVLTDDPRLTVRHVDGRQPRRVVLDSCARTPVDARIMDNVSATIICVSDKAPLGRIGELRQAGAEVLVLPEEAGKLSLERLKYELGDIGVMTLLVEGGSRVATAFLRAHAVDKIAFFVAPRILGRGIPAVADLEVEALSNAVVLKDAKMEQLGDDFLVTGTPGYT